MLICINITMHALLWDLLYGIVNHVSTFQLQVIRILRITRVPWQFVVRMKRLKN